MTTDRHTSAHQPRKLSFYSYEHRSAPLLSRRRFFWRLVFHGLVVVGLIALSLAIGLVGYHAFDELSWLDALVNASMILGGMGPMDRLVSPAAKVFASCYALYSGLILLVSVGIFLAPLFHRLIHRFHLATDESEND